MASSREPTIPTLAPPEQLDYYDHRSITLPIEITPLEAWGLMTAGRRPLLRAAFWMRDAVAARFGVKRVGGFSGVTRGSVREGDYLDFFLVEHVSAQDLVLTERDRHLDVMTRLSVGGLELTVTASVKTHSAFGRLYMLPVAPAHKLIVSSMLRQAKRRLQRGGAALLQR